MLFQIYVCVDFLSNATVSLNNLVWPRPSFVFEPFFLFCWKKKVKRCWYFEPLFLNVMNCRGHLDIFNGRCSTSWPWLLIKKIAHASFCSLIDTLIHLKPLLQATKRPQFLFIKIEYIAKSMFTEVFVKDMTSLMETEDQILPKTILSLTKS